MSSWLAAIILNNTILCAGICVLLGSMMTDGEVVARIKSIAHPAKRIGVMGSVYGIHGLKFAMSQISTRLSALENRIVPPKKAPVAPSPSPPPSSSGSGPATDANLALVGPAAVPAASTAPSVKPRRKLVGPDDVQTPIVVSEPASTLAVEEAAPSVAFEDDSNVARVGVEAPPSLSHDTSVPIIPVA